GCRRWRPSSAWSTSPGATCEKKNRGRRPPPCGEQLPTAVASYPSSLLRSLFSAHLFPLRPAVAADRLVHALPVRGVAGDEAVGVGLPDRQRRFQAVGGDGPVQLVGPQPRFPAPVDQGAIIGVAHGASPAGGTSSWLRFREPSTPRAL